MNLLNRRTLGAVSVIATLAAPLSASAIVINWDASVNGNWSDATKWDPMQVPGASDIAFVQVGGTYNVTVDAPVTVIRVTAGSAIGQQQVLVDATSLTITSATPSVFNQGGVLSISNGGDVTGSGVLSNLALVTLDGSTISVSSMANSGQLEVSGVSTISAPITSNTGSTIMLTPTASLTLSSALTNNGDVVLGPGSSLDVPTLTNTSDGEVTGEGTVTTASLGNDGTVSPGSGAGTLSVTGDFDQGSGGSLAIELGGTLAGEYDVLAVSGTATLDGAIDVSLIGGFFPTDGDMFTVATYGSASGTFSDTASLDLGGGMLLVPTYGATELVLTATFVGVDEVQPQGTGDCITEVEPCQTIDFYFERTNTDPVRAYSVTFTLSPELALCAGTSSVIEGSYLSGFCGGGCTAFQVADLGGGSYTVDATILGGNCGPTDPGVLFTVDVTDTGTDGVGTLTVDAVTIRDCDNQPIPGDPGPVLEIGIDVAAPVAIVDLAATQVVAGNDTDGTTGITISFTEPGVGNAVEVYRKGFGSYPEYDDLGGAVPALPTDPADALVNGWTLTGVTASGQVDETLARDYYYYVAFVTSACGEVSPASNGTTGTLNYHLGDVSDGLAACDGDNAVSTADISLLGANYFQTITDGDPIACLDVGPTDDFSATGLPTTDNEINFEDLVVFGINFGEVSREQPTAGDPAVGADAPALSLVVDPVDGGTLVARLVLEGNTSITKAVHAVLDYDRDALRLVGVGRGALLGDQSARAFQAHDDAPDGLVIDSAILGRGRTIVGSGDLATLRFEVVRPRSAPSIVLGDLRDDANRRLGAPISGDQPDVGPSVVTHLIGARPNPFRTTTHISFDLARGAHVELEVYDVTGRSVRTLSEGMLTAGRHAIAWDGRSDAGHLVPAGVYMYRLRTNGLEETRKVFLSR